MSHYGKYRATIVDNLDPLQLGRLKLRVPALLGTTPTGWATPCLPPGSPVALLDIGDSVWVEFEQGNADHPIWCGVFWTDAVDVPETLRAPATRDTVSPDAPESAMIDPDQ